MTINANANSPYAGGNDVGSSFSPLDLSPVLWLRADLGVTTRDDGGTEYVTAWTDQSGNGHGFAQVTEANQPPVSTLGGRAAIDFDGIDDHLTSGSSDKIQTDVTILYVIDADSVSDNQVVLGDSLLRGTIYHENAAGVTVVGYYDTSHYTGPTTVTGAQQMAVIFDASDGGSVTWRRNGTVLAPTAAYDGALWDAGASTWIVGARDGGVTPFNGRIAELVLVPRVLDAGELAQWDAYAATRYGL